MLQTRLLRVLLLLALAVLMGVPAYAAGPIRILVGTTLIEDIATDLGGGRLGTRTLIPGSACPGHSDLRASDVSFAGEAQAVLIHDWQQSMPMLLALRRAAPEAQSKLRVLSASGNWMLPERQAEATTAVGKLLAELVPADAKDIQARTKARQGRIAALSSRLKARAVQAGLPGTRVICDVMQRPLLEWLGCVVVAEYGRFEGMNPRQLAEVMSKAKAGKAVLVVDNMQSTGGSGKALADDLGAGHVVLTNFPGADTQAATWEQALQWDVERLGAALKARR